MYSRTRTQRLTLKLKEFTLITLSQTPCSLNKSPKLKAQWIIRLMETERTHCMMNRCPNSRRIHRRGCTIFEESEFLSDLFRCFFCSWFSFGLPWRTLCFSYFLRAFNCMPSIYCEPVQSQTIYWNLSVEHRCGRR